MRAVFFLCLLTIFGCGKKNPMDEPVRADTLDGFIKKIDELCLKVDNKTCGYIRGPLSSALPEAAVAGYRPRGEDFFTASEIYSSLNGRTPNQIIGEYKDILLKDLEAMRKRDEDIKANLDALYSSYEKTKIYARDITVSDIRVSVDVDGNPRLGFSVLNDTPFSLEQLVAEAEFYSASGVFLGRTKSFICVLKPDLRPGGRAVIKTGIDSVPYEDAILIKAARSLKVKVTVSSITRNSSNEDEKTLVLALPYSYMRMRELLEESELLYIDTVKKVNDINSKKGE